MDIALWVVTALLAAVFLAAGSTKVITSKDTLAEKGMAYVEDFTAGQIKTIGALEVFGAIGLIVPAFVDGTEWLVPTAATGLLITMVGAVIVHVRRKEPFAPALVLGLLAAFVAVGRFWVETF